MHIKLNMYPPMRYGVPRLSYAEKFDSVLHFFAKEKVEDILEHTAGDRGGARRRP
jgi:hypothetical protein